MERLKTEVQIEVDIQTARESGVHIDAALNPFLNEEDRKDIIEDKAQDPEWD